MEADTIEIKMEGEAEEVSIAPNNIESASAIEPTAMDENVDTAESKRFRIFTDKGQLYSFDQLGKKYAELERLSIYLIDMVQDRVNVEIIRGKYSEWMRIYEDYLEMHNSHCARLGDKDKEEYLSVYQQRELKCNQLKLSIENYFSAVIIQQKQSSNLNLSRRSSSSSTLSKVSSKKLKEEQKKVELQAKLNALKRKRELELAKVSLKLQEEELQLNTDIAVAEAKTQVLNKFEKLELGQVDLVSISRTELEQYVSHDRPTASVDLNPHANTFVPATNSITHYAPVNPSDCDMIHTPAVQSTQMDLVDSTKTAIQSVVQHLRKPVPEVKKFGGNPLEFRRFVRQFEAKVIVNTDSNDERMNYLEQLTYGEANKVITGFSHLKGDQAYTSAMKQLEERYGDDEVIASAFIKRALDWPTIRAGDAKSLDEFSLFLVECENAAESIGAGCVLEYPENIKRLMSKLPPYLHDRWRNIVLRTKEQNKRVKFSDFVRFVKGEAKKSNDPVYGNVAVSMVSGLQKNSKDIPGNRGRGTWRNSPSGIACEVGKAKNGATPETKCSYCSENSHNLEDCKRILSIGLQDRYTHLRSKALCFGCLKKGHMTKTCRNRMTCFTCGRRHPTLLHDESRVNSNSKDTGQSDHTQVKVAATSNVCTNNRQDPNINGQVGAEEASCAMAIIPIKVKLRNKPHVIETYAFYDSGSSVSFCTEEIMHQLGGSGRKINMMLKTMGNPFRLNTYAFDGLQVCDLSMQHVVDMPRVYTKDSMPVSKEHIPTSEEISKWPHLSDIVLHKLDASVGIMIGNNVPDAYTPFEVAIGPSGSPHATKTRLGWIIWNVVRDNALANDFNINRVQFQSQTEDDLQLHELVKRSMNLDFPERLIDDKRENSVDDRNFLKQVHESTHFEDGHYCIALPFRVKDLKLPCNVTQGLQRLNSLKNKLMKDPKFRKDYMNFMETLLEKGYAESVPEEELNRNDGKVWYIPHHGIYHPKKPDKIRVVFDCSASYMGISLNQQLLQGPDFANNLLGVLMRFREEKVAILGDVEAMFYQVKVPPHDRDCLRFLWWPGGDLDKEPVIYRMVVHLFGATSSPSCCNFALKRTAQENSDLFDSVVVDTVTKNMYVDDCLASSSSDDKAISLIRDVSSLCTKGGFHLTKWTSSSARVVESVPENERAKGLEEYNLDNEHPIERALGVYWFIKNDLLGFQINLKHSVSTRRAILSTVSSVYDPLGIASPFVLLAKSILQDLCKQKIDWDDDIDGIDLKRWNDWLDQLPELQNIAVERCCKPQDFGHVESCQIHSFSDASDIGYGIVLYLRLVDEFGRIYCSFLIGKSRVAPLKKITIPRMELTAATRAVKLCKMATEELSYHIDRIYYWTDSASVLRYIANENIRFHTFVANRLAIIHDATDLDQWNYISTELNPADHASRGITINKLLQKPQWLRGPDFLWKIESDWPQYKDDMTIPSDDTEVKIIATTLDHVENSKSSNAMDKLLSYSSDWVKLKKITGWLLLAMDNLRAAAKRTHDIAEQLKVSEPNSSKCEVAVEKVIRKERQNRLARASELLKSVSLTTEILQRAENTLIHYVQHQHFGEELEKIGCGELCKRSSKLYRLSPIIDNGLLRVGGRLERADMSYDSKHPILLPKDSLISKLIIEGIHRTIGHLGRNSILAVLRQKYWILGARSTINGIIAKCVTCRKYQGPCGQQKMANLPRERLKSDEPPFTRVGMDFFGPFGIKRGRSTVKRYGVIFTCMAIRAVHLEMASSLDTDSCINAIRRFISRRGVPKLIRSDNGTNLVGAERELREEIQNWNNNLMNAFMLQKNIKWEFNPAGGSHFGGVWERLIRSVRKVLYSVMREQIVRLDDEGLLTLMCEVEAILNGRPLSEVSNDVNDLEVLTPSHLLLLRPGESFPPGTFNKKDNYVRRRWRQIQYLADLFWRRWVNEYLPLLLERQKWVKQVANMRVGDIVIVMDNTPRNMWIMGRILEVVKDKEGIVRFVKVKTSSSVLTRPIAKLCVILESNFDNVE